MNLAEVLQTLHLDPSTLLSNNFQPSHVGWVPCVSGHLNFALAKVGLEGSQEAKGKRDKTSFELNYPANGIEGSHVRKVILNSWVDWKDSIEPSDGTFNVTVLASAPYSRNLDKRTLNGKIYISLKTIFDNEAFANPIRNVVIDLHRHKNDCKNEKRDINTELVNKYFDQLDNKLNGAFPISDDRSNKKIHGNLKHQYCISFFVAHNGITFLRLDNKDELEDQYSFGYNEQYTIIRQAFFYIKYAIHTHKHHEHDRDNLTTIIEIQNEHDCSHLWLQLSGQLKRGLTTLKRAIDITKEEAVVKSCHTANGIIGYLTSLLAQLNYYGFIDNRLVQREVTSLKGLKKSISVHQKDASNRSFLKRPGAKPIILAMLSLFILMISNVMHVNEIAKEEYIEKYIDVYNDFLRLCFLIFLSVVLHFIYIRISSNSKVVKALLNNSGFFKRKVLQFLVSLTGILALILILLLVSIS